MKRIKLLKAWRTKKAGDIINIADKAAENIVSIEAGEYVDGEDDFKEIEQKDKKLPLDNPIVNDEGTLVEKKQHDRNKEKEERLKVIKSANLPINNYMQNAEFFYKIQPYFYDKIGVFWFWQDLESRYQQVEPVEVMEAFDRILGFNGQTVSSSIKNNTLEAMKRVGLTKKPKDAPKKWVQFKDKAISLKSGKVYDVTYDYFFCNPIPWRIGKSDETPTLDKLFKDWVGEKYVQTLYEVIAYCCYTDYPIQLLFCLFGSGRNGKGCFLKILDKFIGKDNVTSTSLSLIAGNTKSRFESSKLYKKLVALMGETEFGMLNNTSLIKQLTGGDKIGFEQKGKDPFDDYNYAKIIIASNSLPTTQDTSDGFFRRWLIIDFPNEFPEGKDITETIPEIEYNNLAKKVYDILPKLLDKGMFTNQGEIEERRKKYIYASNPLSLFLKVCCEDGDFVSYSELYTAYVYYLKTHKKRRVKSYEFKAALEDEGFWVEKTSKNVGMDSDGSKKWKNGRWVENIRLKDDWKKYVCDDCAVYDTIPILPYTRKNKVGIKAQMEYSAQGLLEIEELLDPTNIKCVVCGSNPSHFYAKDKYFCTMECFEQFKAQKSP